MASRRQREPEAAPDEYQAPFSLPIRNQAPSNEQEDGEAQDAGDEVQMASSPFFDEKEHAEAMAWARSEQAVDDASDTEPSASSAVKISSRKRRDSQVSSYGDFGSVFDGPSAGIVPSSVSSMHHAMSRPELSRRASSRSRRRISREAYSPTRSRKLSLARDGEEEDVVDDAVSVTSGRTSTSVRSTGAGSTRFGKKRRVPQNELDDDERPRGMLGNILASFRGDRPVDDDARSRTSRRPSLGRRRSSTSSVGSGRASSRGDNPSDEEDSDDDFGLEYGSEDDSTGGSLHSTSSDEAGSNNRGGVLPSAFGPLSASVDPVFGDSRISTGREPEDELDAELQGVEYDHQMGSSGFGRVQNPDGTLDPESLQDAEATRKAREEMTYLDKSSRSRQQIYLPDEDSLIRFTGYQTVSIRKAIWVACCILSVGILYLLGRWLPKLWLRWTCKESSFEEAHFVVVENQYGDLHLVRPETVPFARPLATAFPPSSRDPPCTLAEHQSNVQAQLQIVNRAASRGGSKVGSAKSSIKSGKATNGNGASIPANGHVLPREELPTIMAGVETEQLMDLTYMTYRYTRFFLHPPSGRWRMVKDWRDPTWASNASASQGNTWDAEKDRTTLFGKNEIEIEDKGVLGLLIDEVLHPFYSELQRQRPT